VSEQSAAQDRNWNELLQELRVTQTGLQILTGFMVTLPFQDRFKELSSLQVIVYLGTLATSVLATVLVLAPVNYHRVLFRQRQKEWLVLVGNRCARAGLLLAAAAMLGVVWLLFDFVRGAPVSTVVLIIGLATFITVWMGVPLLTRGGRVLAGTPEHSPRERAESAS
jgi:Family of unknown function (DUF6328)